MEKYKVSVIIRLLVEAGSREEMEEKVLSMSIDEVCAAAYDKKLQAEKVEE